MATSMGFGHRPKRTVNADRTPGASHRVGPIFSIFSTASEVPPPVGWSAGLVAKAPCRKYSAYVIVRTEPTTRPTIISWRGMPTRRSSFSTAVSADSLAMKPQSGGMPAIDSAEIQPSAAMSGSRRPRPESSRTSRVPVEWSMAPTIMNSAALNRVWLKVSASPACIASREPIAVTDMMKPSWETVP